MGVGNAFLGGADYLFFCLILKVSIVYVHIFPTITAITMSISVSNRGNHSVTKLLAVIWKCYSWLSLTWPTFLNIEISVGTGESSGAMKNRKKIYRDDKDGK